MIGMTTGHFEIVEELGAGADSYSLVAQRLPPFNRYADAEEMS